jgi:hypothetical protein
VASFRIEFQITKQGFIKQIRFWDYQNDNKNYYEADFNILRAFKVQNFSYNEVTRNLYFEFEGLLYQHYYPESFAKSKYLKGKVVFEGIETIPCSFFPDEITSAMPSNLLRINNRIVWSNSTQVQYIYFTDNGYMLVIHNTKKFNEIAVGTYIYTNSTPLKITLHQYKDILKCSPIPILKNEEWTHYDCEGEITILQHGVSPFAHSIGTFSLQAKDSNRNVIHTLPAVSFKIAP